MQIYRFIFPLLAGIIPAIHLIRHKQFLFSHEFTDKEVLDDQFVVKMDSIFQAIRPFFDYMSTVLTTNMDGEDAG